MISILLFAQYRNPKTGVRQIYPPQEHSPLNPVMLDSRVCSIDGHLIRSVQFDHLPYTALVINHCD